MSLLTQARNYALVLILGATILDNATVAFLALAAWLVLGSIVLVKTTPRPAAREPMRPQPVETYR